MSGVTVWLVILVLGAGTYLIRFSFLGLIGSRPMPPMALKLLRYTPVAIFPGLVTPLVLTPAATDGVFDPARGLAAAITLGAGLLTRNMLAAVGAGAASLYALLWLLA